MAENRLHQQTKGSATVEQDPVESEVYNGDETLRSQDTSAPRHFGTKFGIGAEVSEDTSAPLSVTYTRRCASQSLNT